MTPAKRVPLDAFSRPPVGDGHVVERVAGWLRAVTYKPGWSFEVGPDMPGGVVVRIASTMVDTYAPATTRRIEFGAVVGAYDTGTAENFYRWLMSTVEDLERHEAAEWLRVNGVMIADPHRGGRNDTRGRNEVHADLVAAAMTRPVDTRNIVDRWPLTDNGVAAFSTRPTR